MKKKIERKGDILTSPYNNGNRKEREREREILSYILTDYIANHRWPSSLGPWRDWSSGQWLTLHSRLVHAPRLPLKRTFAWHVQCASLTTVKLVHRSFVWHKTPLEPVFRLLNELEIGGPGSPSWIISARIFLVGNT